MPSSRRVILAASQSFAGTLRVAMGEPNTLTATDAGYRFIMCRHPRRKRHVIKLVTGEIIGYLCTECDGAIYKDNLEEIISGAVPSVADLMRIHDNDTRE